MMEFERATRLLGLVISAIPPSRHPAIPHLITALLLEGLWDILDCGSRTRDSLIRKRLSINGRLSYRIRRLPSLSKRESHHAMRWQSCGEQKGEHESFLEEAASREGRQVVRDGQLGTTGWEGRGILRRLVPMLTSRGIGYANFHGMREARDGKHRCTCQYGINKRHILLLFLREYGTDPTRLWGKKPTAAQNVAPTTVRSY